MVEVASPIYPCLENKVSGSRYATRAATAENKEHRKACEETQGKSPKVPCFPPGGSRSPVARARGGTHVDKSLLGVTALPSTDASVHAKAALYTAQVTSAGGDLGHVMAHNLAYNDLVTKCLALEDEMAMGVSGLLSTEEKAVVTHEVTQAMLHTHRAAAVMQVKRNYWATSLYNAASHEPGAWNFWEAFAVVNGLEPFPAPEKFGSDLKM